MTSPSGASCGQTNTSSNSSSSSWLRNSGRWPTTPTTSMISCTFGQLLTSAKGMRFIASVLISSTDLLRHASITSTIKYRWGRFISGAATMVSHLLSVGVQCSRNHIAWTAMCRYIHTGDSRWRSLTFTFSTDLSLGMVGYRPDVHCPHIGYVTANVFGYYTNLGIVPREVECASSVMYVFLSRSQSSIALTSSSDSISPKRPKSCTRSHSSQRDLVR